MKTVALALLVVAAAHAAHVPQHTQVLAELEGAQCVRCPFGQKDAGNCECECDIGFAGTPGAFSIGRGQCSRCQGNSYQDKAGQANCVPCPAGSSRLSGENPTLCVCEPGFGYNDATQRCEACAANSFKSFRGNVQCIPCDDCPMGQTLHEACTATRNTMCKCAAGNSGSGNPFVAGFEACDACSPGNSYQEKDNGSECDACDDCGVGEEHADDCTPIANTRCQCARGYAGHNGAFSAELSPCTRCANGQQYQDTPGSASCKACSACTSVAGQVDAVVCSRVQDSQCKCAAGYAGHAGAFVFGSAQCTACAANQYQPNEGMGSCMNCDNCPAGSVEVEGCTSTKNKQCKCDVGFAGENGVFSAHDGSCSACGAGTYQNAQGQANCITCPANSARAAGSDPNSCSCNPGYTGDGTQESGCQACPANTYKSTSGSGNCEACPAMSSSAAGSTSIGDCGCDAGTVRNGDTCEKIFFRSGFVDQISLETRELSYSSISNPVVFVSPLTFNGGDIAVVRVNAGTNKYTAKILEPECMDQRHPVKEDFHWLVMEQGTHSYGGATIAAFTKDDITVEQNTDVNFPQGAFTAAPKCISYIQSNANTDRFLATRIVSTGASSLQVRIEPDEEAKKDTNSWPTKETVGFLCVEGGKTELDGIFGKFTVGVVGSDRGETTKAYSHDAGTDHVFVHMVSRNGPNPVIVRHVSYSNGQVSFKLQEDKCNDSETWHVAETHVVLGFPQY